MPEPIPDTTTHETPPQAARVIRFPAPRATRRATAAIPDGLARLLTDVGYFRPGDAQCDTLDRAITLADQRKGRIDDLFVPLVCDRFDVIDAARACRDAGLDLRIVALAWDAANPGMIVDECRAAVPGARVRVVRLARMLAGPVAYSRSA